MKKTDPFVPDETFDTPPSDEVLQIDDVEPIVSVDVKGIVRTDEMPCNLATAYNIRLPAASRAVKILNDDPRRKRCVIWCNGVGTGLDIDGLCVAGSEADANDFVGAFLHAGTGLLRYEFTFRDGLWARAAELDDSTQTIITPGTGTIVVSVINEQWAR